MRVVKIILKTLKWILIGVLSLIIIVLVAIQTPPVKKQIIRIAEKQINPLLNAELSIGRLTGNFFTGLEIHDVLLTSELQDTIAFIPLLDLKYKLLPLIRKEIQVNQVIIEEPYIFLEQLSDSTWNLQHIAKPTPEKEDDTTSSAFNMFVQLSKLALNNGNIYIKSFNPQIPQQIQSLYIDLSGSYSTSAQEADIKDFRFITVAPDLELKRLNIKATGDTASINLASLILESSQNLLSIEGEYRFDNVEKSYLILQTDPLILEEFRDFLPPDFELQAKPVVHLNAELEDKLLNLDLQLKDNNQGIDLQLLSSHLIEYFSDSNAAVTYDLSLDVDKIDVNYWLNNPQLAYIIDGKLTANGEGLNPKTMSSHVRGNFGNIVLQGTSVEKLDILIDYLAGDATGEIDGAGSFGSIYVKPQVRQLMGNRPVYMVNLITKNLNIAPIMGEQYASDVNLKAFVNGAGFNLNQLNAEAKIEVSPSQAMGYTVDTLGTEVNFRNQNLTINSLIAEALDAKLMLNGNYSLRDTSDLTLSLQLDSVDKIAALADIKNVETSLDLNAHLTGRPDDLHALLDLNVGRTRYEEYILGSLFADINGQLKGKEIFVDGNIQANEITAAGMVFDSVVLQAATNTKDIDMQLHVGSEDIKTNISSLIQLGETIQIALSELWLDYKGYQWEMQGDTSHISIGKTDYEIQNFALVSNSTDTVQSISANGIVSRNSNQDFKLDIENLDIGKIAEIFAPEQEAVGKLNLHAQLNGTALSPTLEGKIFTEKLSFKNFPIDTFNTDILLKDNLLNADVYIAPKDSGNLAVKGQIPMMVRLDSMTFAVKPQNSDPINLQASINKLPLSIANIVYPMDKANGYVQSDISIGGTFGKPDISGNLNVNDGQVEIKTYGIDYRDIEIGINIEEEAIRIDTFLIQSRKGNMKATGNVQFQSELYKGQLNTSELRIDFDRFHPLDHKYYNMEMSGDIELNATRDSLNFSGDINIPEAMVYLPAVMSLFGGNVAEIPKPLLVVELEKDSLRKDSIIYNRRPDTISAPTESQLAFMNNMQGRLKVKIPRNTWIRNDDMRLELSGDVEIVKHRDFFELFGTVDVVRGQYSLMGKVFIIETGTITFQGGEKLNPLFNIEATYSFRDKDRTKRELALFVTGDLSAPEIKFTYEGSSISEGDALSYILFGTNLDALTSGEQQSIGQGLDAAGLAGMVASSLISSQLTKFLGNTFNVDYIEFKSDSSFDNASFTVGKYITNKLFVSYQQTIGHIDDADVARYEMTMEYEVFRFLFLQLTSSSLTNGVDVIFKVNSKTK